jgi:hypothetical protein
MTCLVDVTTTKVSKAARVTKAYSRIPKHRQPAFHLVRTDLFAVVAFVIVIGMGDVATV